MKEIILSTMGGLVCLAIAVVCLVWPDRVQQFALDYYASHRTAAKWNPFMEWMKTRQYIWSLRILGLISLTGVLLALLVIMRATQK